MLGKSCLTLFLSSKPVVTFVTLRIMKLTDDFRGGADKKEMSHLPKGKQNRKDDKELTVVSCFPFDRPQGCWKNIAL